MAKALAGFPKGRAVLQRSKLVLEAIQSNATLRGELATYREALEADMHAAAHGDALNDCHPTRFADHHPRTPEKRQRIQ